MAPADQALLRVAVIGVGGMGRHHARILHDRADTSLVGVVDANGERARAVAQEFDCVAYESIDELVSASGVEAVTVAVATVAHHDVGMRLIEHGLPFLMEKPIAGTAAEGRALVAAASARGVLFAVGHIERFNPAVRELKRVIAAGELGNVLSVSARRVGILPPRLSQTSVIVDLAVHDIDVVSFLLDSPPELRGAMSGRAWGHQHNDWADLLLAYRDVACSIQVNWITPIKIRTLSVTGARGYAELNYVTQELDLYQAAASRESLDFDEFVRQYGEPARKAVPVKKEEPLALELASFVSSVRRGAPVDVDGAAGLRALEIAEGAAALALRTDAKVV